LSAADVKITFNLTTDTIDLVRERYDVGIQIAHKADPGLVARKLASNRRVVCGSPAYFERHGVPRVPDDLLRHNCFIRRTPTDASSGWHFQVNGKVFEGKVTGRQGEDTGLPAAVRGERGTLAKRAATLYTSKVIKSFQHKGLKAFYEQGSKSGIQPHHADRLSRQLTRLDIASSGSDMNVPGWGLHPLAGQLSGHWSVWVNGNWRMTFTFENGDAVLVNYQDYH
jgi:proteic killer suppression protein